MNHLSNCEKYPQFFWSNNKQTIIAIGAKETFSSLPLINELVIGGMSFTETSPLWNRFPKAFFFTPKQLISSAYSPPRYPPSFPKVHSISHFSDCADWKQLAASAIERIKKKHMQKVVLARRTTIEFIHPPSPWDILTLLPNRGTAFCLRIDPENAFFGVTPETLFSREGRELFTEAVAGTRTKERQEELLFSGKEIAEFEYVSTFLEEKIDELCSSYDKGQRKIKNAGSISHLWREFNGQLYPHITDQLLLSTLHPTPAVGGLPQNKALDWLQTHESIQRGWYSGAIGFSQPDRAEFSVAIRSALLQNQSLHLFAGVGIVEDSDPQLEWNELDAKIEHFLTGIL